MVEKARREARAVNVTDRQPMLEKKHCAQRRYLFTVARVMQQGWLLLASGLLLCLGSSQASAQRHPILEQLAHRVIQEYQTSSCEQLAAQRPAGPTGLDQTRRRFSTFPAQPPPPPRPRQPPLSETEQKFVQDQQLREAFVNRVAAPIANKLFECGIIPW